MRSTCTASSSRWRACREVSGSTVSTLPRPDRRWCQTPATALEPRGVTDYRRLMDADGESWRASRREAFEAHAQAQRRAEAAESEQARPLVADFVRRAREQQLAPEPLRARAYSGSATYRTRLRGWYLKPTGPLAIGEDGEFYVLIATPGLSARLRGVDVAPSPPPLAVGRGARDGESMSLQELLEWRLAAGDSFRRL